METPRAATLFMVRILFVFAWSSGWLSAEIAVQYATTPFILSVRFTGATVVLSCWWLIGRTKTGTRRRVAAKEPDRRRSVRWRSIGGVALIGILSQTVWLWAVLEAQRRGVPPGTNALINAVQPFVTACALALFLGERTGTGVLVGIAVACVGLFLSVRHDIRGPGTDLGAFAVPLVSVTAMTCAIVLQRVSARRGAAHSDRGPESLLIQTAASAVVSLLHLAAVGVGEVRWHPPFVVTLVWIIAVSHIASYALFWYLVDRTSPTRASALLLASPPTTIVLDALLFTRRIGATEVVGAALVLLGLALGRDRTSRRLPGARYRTPGRRDGSTEGRAGDCTRNGR